MHLLFYSFSVSADYSPVGGLYFYPDKMISRQAIALTLGRVDLPGNIQPQHDARDEAYDY